MSSINKSFVKLFKTLYAVDTSNTQFVKVASVYSKIDINETIVLKFYQDYQNNKSDITKLKIFQNTPIESIVDKVNVVELLDELFETCKMFLMNQNHTCSATCEHKVPRGTSKKKSKLEKLLSSKHTREKLKKELDITNESDLNKLLQETMDSVKDSPELAGMFDAKQLSGLKSLFNNNMFKNITKKLMDPETTSKLQALVSEFMNKEDVKCEIEKVKLLFNEQSFLDSISTLIEKLKHIKDINDIMALKDDKTTMDFVTTMEKHLTNELIDSANLEKMVTKYSAEFMDRIKELKIIDMKTLTAINLLSSSFGAPEQKKSTKEDKKSRRNKKQKDYRRKLRNQYKNM